MKNLKESFQKNQKISNFNQLLQVNKTLPQMQMINHWKKFNWCRKALLLWKMVHHILVNGMVNKDKVMVCKLGQMARNMKENGLMISQMERVS